MDIKKEQAKKMFEEQAEQETIKYMEKMMIIEKKREQAKQQLNEKVQYSQEMDEIKMNKAK